MPLEADYLKLSNHSMSNDYLLSTVYFLDSKSDSVVETVFIETVFSHR